MNEERGIELHATYRIDETFRNDNGKPVTHAFCEKDIQKNIKGIIDGFGFKVRYSLTGKIRIKKMRLGSGGSLTFSIPVEVNGLIGHAVLLFDKLFNRGVFEVSDWED